MKPVVIAGARPNFMKVAPLMRALHDAGTSAQLVHTGQHYDDAMSGFFFRDLGMDPPTANLEVGSASHAVQTAKIMSRFDAWLDGTEVDTVVVAGDVNSSAACALVASKRGLPVAHVEAGLRSFDRSMPEEINRLVVDVLATWLLTPSPDADENLLREGVAPERIFRVGNIMVDSLLDALDRAPDVTAIDRLGVGDRYGLVTLHRPALVDDEAKLTGVLHALDEVGDVVPLVFPVHPRTRGKLAAVGWSGSPRVHLVDPTGYLEFVRMEASAALVLTDSGGVQEETTCLGVPCLTLRDNTERPITVTQGTNRVVGTEPSAITAAAAEALRHAADARRPALWDGKTAKRIVDVLDTEVPASAWLPGGTPRSAVSNEI
jgi:UDP-N-acetylglucosamine 2-epimerase (non-hydrolysing)